MTLPSPQTPRAHLSDPTKTDRALLLEGERPFAQSMLWRLGRNFYAQKGPAAWTSGVVPFYITSNPFIAHCYAQLVLAFLADCLNARNGAVPLERGQPVYILELAAGHGRFSYYFMQELQELKAASALRDLEIRYVMVDFANSNLTAWEQQPLFEPFRAAGLLDFALFDIEDPGELTLHSSGITLRPSELGNPLIVFANYIFDTIAQDLFRVADGQLFEGLVSLRYLPGGHPDLSNPEVLSSLSTEFTYRPAAQPYYGDRELDALLDSYKDRLAGTDLLVPTAAIRCMRRLSELANGRLLLIASDKGHTHLDEMFYGQGQHVQYHGSFSCMVNFHALARIFSDRGGTALLGSKRNTNLKTVVYVLGTPEDQLVATRHAFKEHAEGLGPDDYYRLLRAQDSRAATVEQILSVIYLSRFDPEVFCQFGGALVQNAFGLNDGLREELLRTMARLRSRHYPIGMDLPFELSRVYLALGRPREALASCMESIRLYGEHAVTWCNAGLCHYYAEQPAEALRCVKRALTLDPGHAMSRAWVARLSAQEPALRSRSF